MQFLGGPPGAAIAILAKVINHQPHVSEMAHARFGMPEPKTFREVPHQSRRALDQFRRSGNRRRSFVQFIGSAGHVPTLRITGNGGKVALSFADLTRLVSRIVAADVRS